MALNASAVARRLAVPSASSSSSSQALRRPVATAVGSPSPSAVFNVAPRTVRTSLFLLDFTPPMDKRFCWAPCGKVREKKKD